MRLRGGRKRATLGHGGGEFLSLGAQGARPRALGRDRRPGDRPEDSLFGGAGEERFHALHEIILELERAGGKSPTPGEAFAPRGGRHLLAGATECVRLLPTYAILLVIFNNLSGDRPKFG